MKYPLQIKARGDKAEIVRFKRLCFFNEQLKFSKIVTPPVRFTADWCKTNWGCSCNPKTSQIKIHFQDSIAVLEVSFYSESKNINQILDELQKQFPSISFSLHRR